MIKAFGSAYVTTLVLSGALPLFLTSSKPTSLKIFMTVCELNIFL